mmetsp:Transcript_6782/g.14832  ORF Transcript_6782/g.14832 Transcript_6782/m.14832 type:complete len:205 (-) Transcript_6782:1117-1731(-)
MGIQKPCITIINHINFETRHNRLEVASVYFTIISYGSQRIPKHIFKLISKNPCLGKGIGCLHRNILRFGVQKAFYNPVDKVCKFRVTIACHNGKRFLRENVTPPSVGSGVPKESYYYLWSFVLLAFDDVAFAVFQTLNRAPLFFDRVKIGLWEEFLCFVHPCSTRNDTNHEVGAFPNYTKLVCTLHELRDSAKCHPAIQIWGGK